MNESQHSRAELEKNNTNLKDLLLRINSLFKELIRNWWLIVLFCLPFLLFNVYKHFVEIPTYRAEVKFLVEGESGGGFSGLGGLLGQFGISRGGGKSNPYQIIEVSKSKRILQKVLFTQLDLDRDYIANKIIDTYNLNDNWGNRYNDLVDFKFSTDTLLDVSDKNRLALKLLIGKMIGMKNADATPLLKVKFDDNNGIYSFESETESEELSLALVNELYENVRSFYEEKFVEDKIVSRDLLRIKSDSIQGLIDGKMYEMAVFSDRNRGLISRQESLVKEKLQIQIQGLVSAYTEVFKNFELADFTLKQSKPIFLQIEKPFSPIEAESEPLLSRIIFSLLTGGFLGAIFVVARMMIREAFQN